MVRPVRNIFISPLFLVSYEAKKSLQNPVINYFFYHFSNSFILPFSLQLDYRLSFFCILVKFTFLHKIFVTQIFFLPNGLCVAGVASSGACCYLRQRGRLFQRRPLRQPGRGSSVL
jgi:hypothetical protein